MSETRDAAYDIACIKLESRFLSKGGPRMHGYIEGMLTLAVEHYSVQVGIGLVMYGHSLSSKQWSDGAQISPVFGLLMET